jgi:hypothetical protein
MVVGPVKSNNIQSYATVSEAGQVRNKVPEKGTTWSSRLGGFILGWDSTRVKKTSLLREQHNQVHKWTDDEDYDSGKNAGKKNMYIHIVTWKVQTMLQTAK